MDRIEEIKSLTPTPIIKKYVEMMADISEAPLEFHAYTFIHTISSIMGRNFYIKQGTDDIFPNLYTLIVAPSSLYHKTSATSMFRKLLFEIDYLDKYFGAIGSPEGLLERMGNQEYNGTVYLYYSECGELLSSTKKTFMSNIIDILNDGYDCNEGFKKSLKKEEYRVDKPCITFLGSTQLDSLTKDISESDILSGFIPRFFICYSLNKQPYIHFRKPLPVIDEEIISGLITIKNAIDFNQCDLNVDNAEDVLKTEPVEFTLSEGAIEIFNGLSDNLMERTIGQEDKITKMYGRARTLVLKLAMIIHMAKLDFSSFIISEETIAEAFDMMMNHIYSYEKLVGKKLQFTGSGKKELKAIEMLKDMEEVRIRDLCRALNYRKHEVLELMEEIVNDGIAIKLLRNDDPRDIRGYKKNPERELY